MSGEGGRSRFELAFVDEFGGAELDSERWLDHYLPHWTTPERSAARYGFDDGGLCLRIEADQPAWRTEDGPMRVSNIQTGSFSGPVGSSVGQHRHRPDLSVRTAQPTHRLWAPTHGRVEVTAQANSDHTCMLGIWLVGLEEDSPEHSGEICLAELFGNTIGPHQSTVRLGIKAHHDPRLTMDVSDVVLPIDATDEHTYAADWDGIGVRFYVDDDLVKSSEQRLDYPLQLMIDLFEFPVSDDDARDPAAYPKTAHIRSVRGYSAERS